MSVREMCDAAVRHVRGLRLDGHQQPPGAAPRCTRIGSSGLALVTVLVTLVAVSVLAVSSLQSTVLGVRLAGAAHDRALALRSAEAALHDARLDLLGLRADGSACPAGSAGCRSAGQRPLAEARGGPGAAIATRDCAAGQCTYATDAGAAPWRRFLAGGCDADATVPYGRYTQAGPLPGVAQPPCYLIEIVRTDSPPPDGRYLIRITARAAGASPGTVVMLQQTLIVEDS